MEVAGDDVALEPDQATTTHSSDILPHGFSSPTASHTTFLLSLFNHRGPNCVYDNHQYSGSIPQDDTTHGAFLARLVARVPCI